MRRYYCSVIKTFADKEVEKLFQRVFSRKLPPEVQRIARYKLEILDAAETINDLRFPPANHLEKLKGDRSEQYSVRINDRWRFCFIWHNNDAYDVEIVDYH